MNGKQTPEVFIHGTKSKLIGRKIVVLTAIYQDVLKSITEELLGRIEEDLP